MIDVLQKHVYSLKYKNPTTSGLLLHVSLYSSLSEYCFSCLLIFILVFSYPISAGKPSWTATTDSLAYTNLPFFLRHSSKFSSEKVIGY